ncbi:MAG: YtcP3 [Paenibacillus sp.]|nr:YtcP3 [Paenibacillus sp.]
MTKHQTIGSRLFDIINYLFLFIIASLAVIPFIYIIAGSMATEQELLEKSFLLFPSEFSFTAYQYIFETKTIPKSLLVTIYITLAGTFVNLLLTSLMAYPLARRDLDGRKYLMLMVLFAMLFNGGMIPTFLVVKELGLLNSTWSLILPGAINAFNLIIMRNFFMQLPDGLEEAARIDGCNDLGILFRIVLPLSLPAMATFSLFYAVGHWNSFFSAILYINNAEKWPIQVWLRQIVIMSQGGFSDYSEEMPMPPAQTMKMAVIVISTVPILLVYPFLQKHFAKGVLVGSVKG